jgi:uracil phosphoribosyltransferase
MAALEASEGVVVLQSRALKHLFTTVRDEKTSSADFAFCASRIMRILAEEVHDAMLMLGSSSLSISPDVSIDFLDFPNVL